jgi:hypothetical protein
VGNDAEHGSKYLYKGQEGIEELGLWLEGISPIKNGSHLSLRDCHW